MSSTPNEQRAKYGNYIEGSNLLSIDGAIDSVAGTAKDLHKMIEPKVE